MLKHSRLSTALSIRARPCGTISVRCRAQKLHATLSLQPPFGEQELGTAPALNYHVGKVSLLEVFH